MVEWWWVLVALGAGLNVGAFIVDWQYKRAAHREFMERMDALRDRYEQEQGQQE